jgi:hypothetical protein
MAALEPKSSHITTSKPADQVRAELEANLQSLGATIVPSEGGTLEATTGKKFGTRMLGAMFVPDAWLPLHHSLTFSPSGTDTRVDITVHDDFGMGLRGGFSKKYNRFMDQRLQELTAAAG